MRNGWAMMEWAYLIIEATFWVQVFEEFHVGFSPPEFHVGYLEVAPDFIGVHHDFSTFWRERLKVDVVAQVIFFASVIWYEAHVVVLSDILRIFASKIYKKSL